VRDLQERYKTKQAELDYLKIVRPGRVAYLEAALVHPGSAVVADCLEMRNDQKLKSRCAVGIRLTTSAVAATGYQQRS